MDHNTLAAMFPLGLEEHEYLEASAPGKVLKKMHSQLLGNGRKIFLLKLVKSSGKE